MPKKTLSELFGKYDPSPGRCTQIMNSAGDYTFRTNKEDKCIEVRINFESILTKRDLQTLENEIKSAYSLNYVHIIPRYAPERFTAAYVDEMLVELQRRGAVAHGFFYDYDYDVDMDNRKIEIKIGFSNGGIPLPRCMLQLQETLSYRKHACGHTVLSSALRVVNVPSYPNSKPSSLYIPQRLVVHFRRYSHAK